LNHLPPAGHIAVSNDMVRDSQRRLSTTDRADRIDAVAIGSPHLSIAELDRLEHLLRGRRLAVPIYACTGRHALMQLGDRRAALESAGVVIVADTCVVVTPILPATSGAVLMTNSGKFAHYAPSNTGYLVLYASLADCVESAVAGAPRIGSTS
jgi:predicted aconitase